MVMKMNLYDIEVLDSHNQKIKLSKYQGHVLLIVNTATECEFTEQYDHLEDLYEKYHEQGFTILDFPCNQFGEQAPGTMEEIMSFCADTYGVSFPQFAKILPAKTAITAKRALSTPLASGSSELTRWQRSDIMLRLAPMAQHSMPFSHVLGHTF